MLLVLLLMFLCVGCVVLGVGEVVVCVVGVVVVVGGVGKCAINTCGIYHAARCTTTVKGDCNIHSMHLPPGI